MQYRIDEKSGNMLSILGFGCMRLPRNVGIIDGKKSERILMEAIDAGVNYFDTAYLYPGSETALGKVLKENNVREKVFIATKLPIGICHKTEDFERLFSVQQKRLQTNYIDYYLLHNINSFNDWERLKQLGIKDWVEKKKATGEIKQFGFSFHGPCAEFLKLIDDYDWDFCQIQYNYANENYQAGMKGLKRAGAKKIPVIVMEPLLGGKLAIGLPKKAEERFKGENPEYSPAAWGLRWLMNQPEVTVILSGMNSQAQLADNLHTANTSQVDMLTESEKNTYKEVLEIFEASYKVPCTGCSYCMPCPQNVNIPGCFAAYNASFALGRMTGMTQYTLGTAAMSPNRQGASNCIGCGKCETHCPQLIQIRDQLKNVEKRMEPFYYKGAMNITRLFTKKGK